MNALLSTFDLYLIETLRVPGLTSGSLCNLPTTTTMAPTTTKRTFDEIVSSTAEFCMLQFYKTNYEAAVKELADARQEVRFMEQQVKRARRNEQHQINRVIDLTVDINELRQVNTDLGDDNARLQQQNRIFDNALYETEKTLGEVTEQHQQLMDGHPELHDEWAPKFTEIYLNGLARRNATGINIITNAVDYDSDATEPDNNIMHYLLEETQL